MRPLVTVVSLLAWGFAQAATVYKWVDESGVTHYSDQPYPGAKKIEVQTPQTYTAPPLPAKPAAEAQPKTSATAAYKVCELSRPNADEVFFNVSSVTAKVRLDPDLQSGDTVVIALDGKRMAGLAPAAGEFTLSPVYRGTHSVMAEVQDPQGRSVCRAAPVTFHVRQTSQLSPQSPTQPTPPTKPPAKPTGKP